jgi:hypothetical protein
MYVRLDNRDELTVETPHGKVIIRTSDRVTDTVCIRNWQLGQDYMDDTVLTSMQNDQANHVCVGEGNRVHCDNEYLERPSKQVWQSC